MSDDEILAVWRPIEGAPKDAPLLLFLPDSGDIVIGRWVDDKDFPDGGAWYEEHVDSGWPIDDQPSHFLPLPAPPTA